MTSLLVWWPVCWSSWFLGARRPWLLWSFPLFYLTEVTYCATVNYVVGKHVRRALRCMCVCVSVQVCVVKMDGFSVVELELHPCRSYLFCFHYDANIRLCEETHINSQFTKPDLLYRKKNPPNKTVSDSLFSHLFPFAWSADVLTVTLRGIGAALRKSLIARNENARTVSVTK